MAKGARVSILAHRFYSDADAKETFGTVWRTKILHGTVVTLHKKGGITVKWDGDEVPYKSDYSHIEEVLSGDVTQVRTTDTDQIQTPPSANTTPQSSKNAAAAPAPHASCP